MMIFRSEGGDSNAEERLSRSKGKIAMAKKLRIVCSACGSDNVRRDALAVWSVEAQAWELAAVLDCGNCEDCECERRLVDVEVADEKISLTI